MSRPRTPTSAATVVRGQPRQCLVQMTAVRITVFSPQPRIPLIHAPPDLRNHLGQEVRRRPRCIVRQGIGEIDRGGMRERIVITRIACFAAACSHRNPARTLHRNRLPHRQLTLPLRDGDHARDFTVDDGELTPTLKIKRKPIAANWAAEIESLYADA